MKIDISHRFVIKEKSLLYGLLGMWEKSKLVTGWLYKIFTSGLFIYSKFPTTFKIFEHAIRIVGHTSTVRHQFKTSPA